MNQLCKSIRISTILGALLACSTLLAQPANEAGGPQEIKIDRIAVTLKYPDTYQTFLTLQPIKTIEVSAQISGPVSSVLVKKVNETVNAQAELVRIKSEESQLKQRIAEAELEAAKATRNDGLIDVAKKKLDLALFKSDQTIIRSPIDGQIAEIHVSPNEYVQVGQPLVTVIDKSKLQIDVPIERNTVKEGEALQLNVEDKSLSGTIESILPITEKFANLQDLFVSVAVARVIIDNGNGQLSPGQAVSSDMIPRHPVMEVANSAVKNGEDGQRKVQVIRDGFVKDIPVQLLGQVGETHVFVSGRFADTDDLIVSASQEIADGSWVRPLLWDGMSATPSGGRGSMTPLPGSRSPQSPGGSRTSNDKRTRDDGF